MLKVSKLPSALLLIIAILAIALRVNALDTPSQALSVNDVLARVRANLALYDASIPNLICDESVDSKRTFGGKVKDEMKIESSFSMVRSSDGKSFRETRVKQLVNGIKPKNQKVAPPYFFSGGIVNVLSLVSDTCNNFAFAQDAQTADNSNIVIAVTPRPASPEVPAHCKATWRHSWRAKLVIDPKLFQVLHLEYSVQDVSFGLASHLPFVPFPSTHNTMSFTADYAPMTLGGKTFWLPQTITSTVTDKVRPITLEYLAHYTHYHVFTSTSTILPDVKEVSNN